MKLECKLCNTEMNFGVDDVIRDIIKKCNYVHKQAYYVVLARLESTGFEKYLLDEKSHRVNRYFRKKHRK